MLLPSSLSAGPRPRLTRFSAFTTQEVLSHDLSSPPPLSPSTTQGVSGTCRALQSVLGTGPKSSSRERSSSGSRSPLCANQHLHASARIRKRPPPRSRNGKKRSRDDLEEDEAELVVRSGILLGQGYGLGLQSVMEDDLLTTSDAEQQAAQGLQSTPKRRRKVPPTVPLGLDNVDFLSLDGSVDEPMDEDADLPHIPRLLRDEGYGSMDIEVDQLGQACPQVSKVGADTPFLSLPSSDADAMSIGTPALAFAAMALSPPQPNGSGHFQFGEAVSSPEPADPSVNSSSLCLPDTKVSVSSIDSPIGLTQDSELSEYRLADIFTDLAQDPMAKRPPIMRHHSQAHSDPVEHPSTPPLWSPPTQPHTLPADISVHQQQQVTPPSEQQQSQTHYSWTDADDSQLVALVVGKLRLRQHDWDECARVLGADGYGASLGRRWRELVGDGCVGLKFRYAAEDGRLELGVRGGYTVDDVRSARRQARRVRDSAIGRPDVRTVSWGPS